MGEKSSGEHVIEILIMHRKDWVCEPCKIDREYYEEEPDEYEKPGECQHVPEEAVYELAGRSLVHCLCSQGYLSILHADGGLFIAMDECGYFIVHTTLGRAIEVMRAGDEECGICPEFHECAYCDQEMICDVFGCEETLIDVPLVPLNENNPLS